jgi:nucleoside-diphosphate-sugar epimerase
MNQIVAGLEKIFGKLKVKYEPARPHDFKGAVVSAKKAKELLGWEARTPFEEGLKKYVEFVKAETCI